MDPVASAAHLPPAVIAPADLQLPATQPIDITALIASESTETQPDH